MAARTVFCREHCGRSTQCELLFAGWSDEYRSYLLDLSAWARDAIALALPDQILCRDDCAGLCPECGKDLNAEPHEHVEERTDPRWAALESLRESE